MLSVDIVSSIQKNEKEAKRKLFDICYGKLAAIAARYAKNALQAEEMFQIAFASCYVKIQHHRFVVDEDSDIFIENEFISECISFVKNIRSEYYVSSTVHPTTGNTTKNYNLFENHEVIDFNTLETEILIKALQKMVPAQRLVFNLHVIDGFSMLEVAAKLETSEETVKSNLEKARFNFQKNIEKELKTTTVI